MKICLLRRKLHVAGADRLGARDSVRASQPRREIILIVPQRHADLRGKPPDPADRVSVISFFTVTLMPRRSMAWRSAKIPITVAMHVPSAVATRSVGENDSPRP